MTDSFFNFFESDRKETDYTDSNLELAGFKEYPRASMILFPKPQAIKASLADAILYRKTERNFSNKALDLKTLGNLLFWSVGPTYNFKKLQENSFRRPYPSGGALYPIEIYAVILIESDIAKGVFHYSFKKHALQKLSWVSVDNIKAALPYDFAKKASALILLSFIGQRVFWKYGSLGYKLGLLEGGHVGQNICLVGAALGIGVLPLGGMDYDVVHQELDFAADETIFYQLACGWPNQVSADGCV